MDMTRWHRVLFVFILIAFSVMARLVSSTGVLFGDVVYFDMFAVIALMALTAGFATRKISMMVLPLIAMAFSDMLLYLLGITSTFSLGMLLWLAFFVWTGFMAISLLGVGISKMTQRSSLVWFLGGSIWSVFLFDAWTNFGFYLGFYPHTITGLMACYLAAIPFTLGHLAMVLALAPGAYLLARWGREHVFSEPVSEGEKKEVGTPWSL